MKRLFIALLLLLPACAFATDFSKVQPDKSSITFVSKQMSVPVEGVFKKFTANIRLNPAQPQTGMANIVIDIDSIDAGGAEANDEVKGKSWFNVAEFPRANFVSSSVSALGGGKFEATGKMTIKGKTVALRAPFSLVQDKGVLEVDGVFAMKRLDFGIGSGLWSDTSVVADEVQIKFHFVLK